MDKLLTRYVEREEPVLLYPKEDMAPTRFASREDAKQAVADSIAYGLRHNLRTTITEGVYVLMSEDEVNAWLLARTRPRKRRAK